MHIFIYLFIQILFSTNFHFQQKNMSAGVLSFVKGIDFSRNDFSGDRFPNDVVSMTQATWLKLNRTQLDRVPDVLSNLKKLEHLQMTRNKLQVEIIRFMGNF